MPLYKTSHKKDGLQQYRVRVNYTTEDGKHKQIERTAYGLAEAKETERRILAELEKPKAAPDRTVQQLYDEYIRAKAHEVRTTSLEKSKSILGRSVLPTLKNMPLRNLTAPVLQAWKTGINEQGLAITTRHGYYSEFRALLNYAVKMDYLQKNPLLSVGNFRDALATPKTDKLHYYTAEQFQKFITAAGAHKKTLREQGLYTFFCIAYFTGMRKGEINALKWSDIDGSVIHVRRSVAQKVKGESIVETPPKNKSSYRDIQAPAPLLDVLAAHKAAQQKDPSWSEDWRVCGGPSCLSDTAISDANILYADEAGLPHIRIHDFRHSHASLLCNEGINIQEVARRLGHSNVQQTWNTYAHLYPREEERALAVLDKIQIPEKSPN